MNLTQMKCPNCGETIYPRDGIRKKTNSFNDCLRRCEKCEIGFSNAKRKPTIIYKNYSENIPKLLRKDLDISLNNSLNELNRKNKKDKFGFSTSEDALTWSFFKYFIINNKFVDLIDLLGIKSKETSFDIYLWGTKINLSDNTEFIEQYNKVSNSFNEKPTKRTEPDVIIEFSDKLVFIEVKYLSPNGISSKKEKFKNYLLPNIDIQGIIESEHYELYRNWAFVSKMSNGNNFELINLAPEKLFRDKNKQKLDKFRKSLKSKNGNFRKLSWEEILEKVNEKDYDLWFKKYLNEKLKPTANNSYT